MIIKEITSGLFYEFLQEFEKAVKEGYSFDIDKPFVNMHTFFSVNMVKEEEEEKLVVEEVQETQVKQQRQPTRRKQ